MGDLKVAGLQKRYAQIIRKASSEDKTDLGGRTRATVLEDGGDGTIMEKVHFVDERDEGRETIPDQGLRAGPPPVCSILLFARLPKVAGPKPGSLDDLTNPIEHRVPVALSFVLGHV